MKKKSWLLLLLSLSLALSLVILGGCGDDDDDDNDVTTPSTLVDVTGNWEFSGPGMGLMVLHLVQDASGNITGTVDRASAEGGTDTGEITAGSNVNNTINITIVFDDGQTLELTGTVTDANTMSGTYRSYYDPSAVDEDSWTATRQT